MVGISGLDYVEAAAAMGCALGTIKSRLWRARHEMEKALRPIDPPSKPASRAVRALRDRPAPPSARAIGAPAGVARDVLGA
ncbi:MAG: hypothetical protein ACYCZX_11730 [Rhodospirillaceae bacterium]